MHAVGVHVVREAARAADARHHHEPLLGDAQLGKDQGFRIVRFVKSHGLIIEVPRILAIDGDKREVAQVCPSFFLVLWHFLGESLDLAQHFLRPVDRNLVTADCDIGLHAWREVGAYDFHNTPDSLCTSARLDHEFHDNDVALLGAAEFAARNDDFMRDATIVCFDEAHLALDVQLADNTLMCSLEDLDDRSFAPALVIDAGNAHDNTVTVHHLLTHTSGIKSYTSLEEYTTFHRLDLTHEELLDKFANEPFDFAPGEKLRLRPGESVTLMPGDWHAFWGEGGDVLIGEVSTVNDDETDNIFREPIGRFAEIEEDEPPMRLLVSDYRSWLD